MMPTYIAVPSEYRNAYRVATVLAAIPLDEPNTYVVVAIDPESLIARPTYIAAETSRAQANAPWFADETVPSVTLAGALSNMATLAGRVYPRML